MFLSDAIILSSKVSRGTSGFVTGEWEYLNDFKIISFYELTFNLTLCQM